MNWNSYDFSRDNVYVQLKKDGYKHLSYSQLSAYLHCPYKWKKLYIDKIKEKSYSIDLIFGTAMHEVIQTYITTIYKESAKKADELDLDKLLNTALQVEYKKSLAEGKEHYSNATQMREYFYHGQEIFKELKKRRGEFFPVKDHKLIGIEVPLVHEIDPIKKIAFTAFLDIAIQNTKTDEITIIDLKTSRNGWNAKKKNDQISMSQLLLYKKYYSEQYNVPLEKISILYLILKRVLYTQADFPQKRLQKVIPANGKPSINKVVKTVDNWLNHVFNEDGSYKTDIPYNKAKDKPTCQYCPFYKTEHCNWKDD